MVSHEDLKDEKFSTARNKIAEEADTVILGKSGYGAPRSARKLTENAIGASMANQICRSRLREPKTLVRQD